MGVDADEEEGVEAVTTAADLGITYVLTVRVPQCLGVTPNQMRRWHWSQTREAVAKCRRSVALVLSPHERPSLPVIVTMTRCSVGRCDDDGAIGAMKSARDEIAKWLGVNDNDPRITWVVEQRKVKRADCGTEIKIEARAMGGKSGT